MVIPRKNKRDIYQNARKSKRQEAIEKILRPTEFSKFLVLTAMKAMGICIGISYFLSLLGRDPCIEITVAVITSATSIAVGYEAKSYGEKNSRNKYGITADDIANQTEKSASFEGQALG